MQLIPCFVSWNCPDAVLNRLLVKSLQERISLTGSWKKHFTNQGLSHNWQSQVSGKESRKAFGILTTYLQSYKNLSTETDCFILLSSLMKQHEKVTC